MNFNRFTDLCGKGKEGARISASMACIQLVLDSGAAVIVTSHLGGPADSLAQIAKRLDDFSSPSVWRGLSRTAVE